MLNGKSAVNKVHYKMWLERQQRKQQSRRKRIEGYNDQVGEQPPILTCDQRPAVARIST